MHKHIHKAYIDTYEHAYMQKHTQEYPTNKCIRGYFQLYVRFIHIHNRYVYTYIYTYPNMCSMSVYSVLCIGVAKLIITFDEVPIRHYFPAICMYVFVCICMYLYICMRVYVCMYVCILCY